MTDKQIKNVKPLYKMFSAKDYNYGAVENNRIFMSKPTIFNDVFDSCVLVDYHEFERKYLLKKFSDNEEYCKVISGLSFYHGALEALSGYINNTPENMEIELEYITGKRKGEYNPPFDKNKVGQEIKELYDSYIAEIEKIRASYYVACFTENKPEKNISMWYFYANEYKGFCAEYSFERLIWDMGSSRVAPDDLDYRLCKHIRKVIYYDYVKTIDIDHLLDIPLEQVYTDKEINSFVFKAIYHKNKSWKNENEWRLIIKEEELFLKDVLISKTDSGVLIQFPFLHRLYCFEDKASEKFMEMAGKQNVPISIFSFNNGILNLIDVGQNHKINFAVRLSRMLGKEIKVDFFDDKKVGQ